jgi:hypothetical protein
MATQETLKELRLVAAEAELKPQKLREALVYIFGELGIWGAGTAQSQEVYRPGMPLIDANPVSDWDRGIRLQPALTTRDGTGVINAVRATRDPDFATLTLLGDPNVYQQRRAWGLEEVAGVPLVEPGFYYPNGTHGNLITPNGDTILGVQRSLLVPLRQLPPDTIIGKVDLLGTPDGDTDTFRHPVPGEPGHAMSVYEQLRLASIAVPVGALLHMIDTTPMVYGNVGPQPIE